MPERLTGWCLFIINSTTVSMLGVPEQIAYDIPLLLLLLLLL